MVVPLPSHHQNFFHHDLCKRPNISGEFWIKAREIPIFVGSLLISPWNILYLLVKCRNSIHNFVKSWLSPPYFQEIYIGDIAIVGEPRSSSLLPGMCTLEKEAPIGKMQQVGLVGWNGRCVYNQYIYIVYIYIQIHYIIYIYVCTHMIVFADCVPR